MENSNLPAVIGILLFTILFVLSLSFYAWLQTMRQNDSLSTKARNRLPYLLRDLSISPDNEETKIELFQIMEAFPTMFTDEIYEGALFAVQQSGGAPNAKRFALLVGRLSLGSRRPDGLPTVYDEQAIANDISARTSGI